MAGRLLRWVSAEQLWKWLTGSDRITPVVPPKNPDNPPPPANPNVSPTAAFNVTGTGLTLGFDGSSSADSDGTIASWSWDFGDGKTGTGRNVSHTYAAAGTYTVTLTVRDDYTPPGVGTATRTVLTTAPNKAPIASFTAAPSGQTVSVNASGSSDPDGTITGYAWNWGDGSSAGSGATASHTYTQVGTFVVTLTVTDNSGVTSSTTRSVTVGTATGGQFTMDVTEPSAATTGLGVFGLATGLTVVNGDYTIRADTDVVENLDVSGRIIVASGVRVGTIQNNRVRINGGGYGIDTSKAANMVVVRGNEIAADQAPANVRGNTNGIGVRNFISIRNNIHHVVDGFRVNTSAGATGTNVEIAGNYVHDLYLVASTQQSDGVTHCDCIQMESGDGAYVHGNSLRAYRTQDGTSVMTWNGTKVATSCIMMSNPGTSNVRIDANWCYGGMYQINAGDPQAAAKNSGLITKGRHFNDPYRAGYYIGINTSSALKAAASNAVDANHLLNADGSIGTAISAKAA